MKMKYTTLGILLLALLACSDDESAERAQTQPKYKIDPKPVKKPITERLAETAAQKTAKENTVAALPNPPTTTATEITTSTVLRPSAATHPKLPTRQPAVATTEEAIDLVSNEATADTSRVSAQAASNIRITNGNMQEAPTPEVGINQPTQTTTANTADTVFIDFARGNRQQVQVRRRRQNSTDAWLEHAAQVAKRTGNQAHLDAQRTLDDMARSFEQLGRDFQQDLQFEQANINDLAEKLESMANRAGRTARQVENSTKRFSDAIQHGFNDGYYQQQGRQGQ